MNSRLRHLLISVLLLIPLALDACSFSVRPLSRPKPTEARTSPDISLMTAEPLPSRGPETQPVPDAALPSATPTLISIRADTIPLLGIFESFAMQDIVHALAFTPDGSVVAAAGGNAQDFAIHVWDVASGREIGTLGGHSNIVWDIAFSPDGEMLATVSSDRTAKIRDWRNGDILKILNFPAEVASVRFSPDGQILAVGGVDEPVNQIRNAAVWTYAVGSWEPLVKFPEYWNIAALAFSPGGGTLVGGGTSRNVQVWQTNDGTQVFTLSHAHQVSKAAISPDGSVLATATCQAVLNADCSEGGVWLWDLPTGKLKSRLAAFPDVVENVAFSADGSTLLAASRDGTLRFYNTADYQSVVEFSAPGGISAMALSPDGGLLATGDSHGQVNLWRVVYRP